MSDKYSAEIPVILASAGGIGDAVQSGQGMASEFERASDEYKGCWGEVGEGDSFADTVTEQVEQEREQVLATWNEVYNGVLGLVDAVTGEAQAVARPQTLAAEGIDEQTAQSETRH
ncbi:hypothetical protein ACWCQW_46650 [Streptomyces mirabilis]